MANLTVNEPYLLLESLSVTQESMFPVFFLLLFIYVLSLITNIGIMVLIFMQRTLHQPMYILFCNLSVNDVIGTTSMLPRMMYDVLTPPAERVIGYVECVVQAFLSHACGTTSFTILIIMAYDRYVAICNPLRYSAIMTNSMMVKLSIYAWGASLFFVSILLGLTLRLTRCRSVIFNFYCDNASLFNLACESPLISNVYGLTFTAGLFICSIGSISFTYLKIAVSCLTKKNKETNSRALKTCSTHLVVYLITLWSGFVPIILHRFPQYKDIRKITSVFFYVIPANLNPIIYGVQTRKIREKIVKMFKRNKVTP